jgi:hypothetical protein
LSNPFIARQWIATRRALQEASLLTVFGYSAPRSDSDAVGLLRKRVEQEWTAFTVMQG